MDNKEQHVIIIIKLLNEIAEFDTNQELFWVPFFSNSRAFESFIDTAFSQNFIQQKDVQKIKSAKTPNLKRVVFLTLLKSAHVTSEWFIRTYHVLFDNSIAPPRYSEGPNFTPPDYHILPYRSFPTTRKDLPPKVNYKNMAEGEDLNQIVSEIFWPVREYLSFFMKNDNHKETNQFITRFLGIHLNIAEVIELINMKNLVEKKWSLCQVLESVVFDTEWLVRVYLSIFSSYDHFSENAGPQWTPTPSPCAPIYVKSRPAPDKYLPLPAVTVPTPAERLNQITPPVVHFNQTWDVTPLCIETSDDDSFQFVRSKLPQDLYSDEDCYRYCWGEMTRIHFFLACCGKFNSIPNILDYSCPALKMMICNTFTDADWIRAPQIFKYCFADCNPLLIKCLISNLLQITVHPIGTLPNSPVVVYANSAHSYEIPQEIYNLMERFSSAPADPFTWFITGIYLSMRQTPAVLETFAIIKNEKTLFGQKLMLLLLYKNTIPNAQVQILYDRAFNLRKTLLSWDKEIYILADNYHTNGSILKCVIEWVHFSCPMSLIKFLKCLQVNDYLSISTPLTFKEHRARITLLLTTPMALDKMKSLVICAVGCLKYFERPSEDFIETHLIDIITANINDPDFRKELGEIVMIDPSRKGFLREVKHKIKSIDIAKLVEIDLGVDELLPNRMFSHQQDPVSDNDESQAIRMLHLQEPVTSHEDEEEDEDEDEPQAPTRQIAPVRRTLRLDDTSDEDEDEDEPPAPVRRPFRLDDTSDEDEDEPPAPVRRPIRLDDTSDEDEPLPILEGAKFNANSEKILCLRIQNGADFPAYKTFFGIGAGSLATDRYVMTMLRSMTLSLEQLIELANIQRLEIPTNPTVIQLYTLINTDLDTFVSKNIVKHFFFRTRENQLIQHMLIPQWGRMIGSLNRERLIERFNNYSLPLEVILRDLRIEHLRTIANDFGIPLNNIQERAQLLVLIKMSCFNAVV